MRFFKQLFRNEDKAFAKISGYNDLKNIIRHVLDSEENYNLLFIGGPASAKTLFLQGIIEMKNDGCYFDGSNTTSRILDVLEEERLRIIVERAQLSTRLTIISYRLLNSESPF